MVVYVSVQYGDVGDGSVFKREILVGVPYVNSESKGLWSFYCLLISRWDLFLLYVLRPCGPCT